MVVMKNPRFFTMSFNKQKRGFKQPRWGYKYIKDDLFLGIWV